jgi:hypothetical protein
MSTADWYYCDERVDPERPVGPVTLSRLAELIRTGDLPYNVLVSSEPSPDAAWVEADTLRQVLDAVPLDRERLMREYIEYGEAPRGQEHWGWASDRMYSILEAIPELAWELIAEMIERALSDNSLSFLAASPLEDLLSKDGSLFIVRVEQRAAENVKFRRALGMLRRLGMTHDDWQTCPASRTTRDVLTGCRRRTAVPVDQ